MARTLTEYLADGSFTGTKTYSLGLRPGANPAMSQPEKPRPGRSAKHPGLNLQPPRPKKTRSFLVNNTSSLFLAKFRPVFKRGPQLKGRKQMFASDERPMSAHIRDGIFQLLHNARHDLDGALASLHNDDDFGLRHHTKRMFDALRLAHGQLKALDLNGGRAE